MKIVVKKTPQIGDVERNRLLRLDSLVRMLQDAAVEHTLKAGIDLGALLDSGNTWVLNKLAVKMYHLPCLDELIEIHTWSRSIKRFRGFARIQNIS